MKKFFLHKKLLSSQAWNFLSFDINRRGAPKCLKNCPLPQRGEKKSRHANVRLLLVSFIKSGWKMMERLMCWRKKKTPDGSEARAIIVSDNATRLGEIFALANGPLWKIFLGWTSFCCRYKIDCARGDASPHSRSLMFRWIAGCYFYSRFTSCSATAKLLRTHYCDV